MILLFTQRVLHSRSPNSLDSLYKVPTYQIAQLSEIGSMQSPAVEIIKQATKTSKTNGQDAESEIKSEKDKPKGSSRVLRRLKLGVVSSDFGVHPVSTLIRGFVQV